MLDLFYLHVPKTGGTSIEAYLRKAVGKRNYLGHCETQLLQGKCDEINSHKAAGGHVRLRQLLASGIKYRRLVTSIRDPRTQLVSHLRWLVRIGEAEGSDFYNRHPEHIRETAVKLARMDFSDPAALKHFADKMTPTEIGLFDNFLVRFLTPLHVAGRVEQHHVDATIEALPKFDSIVRTEHLHEDITRVCVKQGYPAPQRKRQENIGRASISRLDLDRNLARLEFLCQFDLTLFKEVNIVFYTANA